ncbi:MAG: SMP-30/gluconolactonase/LRE family protein [Methylobacterium sp.]|nr:SMP-30/gluconolactonase/LRE family protein [Methylobacterium sp.]
MKTCWRWMPLLLAWSALAAAQDAVPGKITGLKNPESAVAGPGGRMYVSEIGEFGKDGDGRIIVIDASGTPHVFSQGMNDPKGLAFYGNRLYVADKNRLLRVGLDGTWEVFAGADAFPRPPQFLNDVETDRQGNIYVSDTGDMQGKGGAVYRIGQNGKVSVVVDDRNPAVQGPNGLLMDSDGSLLEVDFLSGNLYRIHLRSGEMTKIADGFGGGDGIVRGSGGVLYVSDWKNGKVFSVSREGKVLEIGSGFMAAADIGLSADGRFLLVPDMKAGALHWLKIE